MPVRYIAILLLTAVVTNSCAFHSQETGWQRADAEVDAAPQHPPEIPIKHVSFETDEGTNLNVDVSPDGEALTFDLLGDIYLLPRNGGEAVPLTTGRSWDQAPRFSPDGMSVYFVSDRRGYKNIWRVILADRSLHQVTVSESNIMGTPNWTRDGKYLIAAKADGQSGNETVLQLIDPTSGDMTPLENVDVPWINRDTFELNRDRIVMFSGVQAPKGEVYFAEARKILDSSRRAVRIYRIGSVTGVRDLVTPKNAVFDEFKPQLSHNGMLLSYFRQYPDRRTELRVLDRSTGQDRALIKLIDADDASYFASHELWPNYAFTPDDHQIIFWQNGKIHRVRLNDGISEIIPFHINVERDVWVRALPSVQKIIDVGEAHIIRWPSLSDNGETMVFAAIGYIWIIDMETGELRRLTSGTGFEYMPALSPDGRSVAYISFAELEEGYGPARLVVASLEGASSRDLLTAEDGAYLLPSWSPDGSKIALIREASASSGAGGGVQNNSIFGWTDTDEGVFHEVGRVPSSGSLANLHIYARSVGFDPSGETLWFSYPVSSKETALSKANLDGSAYRTLAVGAADIGGIVPAPDLKHLAVTDKSGAIWIIPFAVSEGPVQLNISSADAQRVSESGGNFADWVDTDQITYGFGKNFYHYDVTNCALKVRPINVVFEKPGAAQQTAFVGARLVTISGDGAVGPVIESGTIIMDGQRITAIGPRDQVVIPDDALVANVAGKTILPGLVDTHYHRVGGSKGPAGGSSAFKFPNPDFEDSSAITFGVTSAWEPAGPASDGSPATIDLQVAGRIAGPRWSHSAAGGVGRPYEQLNNYQQAFTAVKRHKELGVVTLKEYRAPTREQRQWLSISAYEQGLGIVSHLENFDGTMTRVVDGYTGGDHPYIPAPFYKDVHELLKQTGYIWTPNIVITPGTVGVYSDIKSYWDEALTKHPDALMKFKSTTPLEREIVNPSVPYQTHRVSRVAKAVASAAKNGVHIGVSAHNMPGSNLHREMWHLWKGGMPIEDVLRATTIGNAEKLGLQEEIGSLEVGKIADFLVLDENPLEDIINTLSLKYTVQGGVVYDSAAAQRADLTSILETDAAVLH